MASKNRYRNHKRGRQNEPIKLAEYKLNREFAINFLTQNSSAHHLKFSCWKDEKIEIYI